MLCGNCEQEPCTCQRQLTVASEKREVQQRYLFKKCANPACSVMIGWQLGTLQGLATCKHCQAGVAHWQKELEQTA